MFRHRTGSVTEELQLVPPSKLAIEDVSKTFRTATGEVLALDRVSLQVNEAEFVCLVGPSGCGKTTLLNIIAGLEKPDSGRVLADGKPVTSPGRDRLVMFQEPALFPWLDVLGNVLFGLKLKPNLTNKDRRNVARYYLELVGLTRFEHANIHELSGGMKQRVSLARALAPNPRVLLMDEPFAALDALTREQLYGDIQQIWKARRKTIVFVTHNVREAACLGFFRHIPAAFRKNSPWTYRARVTLTVSILPAMPPKSCALSKVLVQSAGPLPYEKISFRRQFLCCAHSHLAMGFSGKDLVARIASVTDAGCRLFEKCHRRWHAWARHCHHDEPASYRLFLRNYCWPATGTPDRALEFIA